MKSRFRARFYGNALALAVVVLPATAARAQAPTWQTAVAGSGGTAQVVALATAASGDLYLTGTFFGPTFTLGGITLTNAGGSGGNDDVFVAKWSPATSSFVWAVRGGGIGRDVATGLAVSGNALYVAGWFGSTPGQPAQATATYGGSTVTSAGQADGFVTKLTDAGSTATFGWAQRVGGLLDDYAFAVAASGSSVYVGGAFHSGTAAFGSFNLVNGGGSPLNSTDAFVARLTDTGPGAAFDWATRAGGTGGEYVRALAVSGTSVYAAGTLFTDIASGGTPSTFGTTALTSVGANDVYVAKITDQATAGPWTWVAQGGGSGDDQLNALAVRGTALVVAGQFAAEPTIPGPAVFGPAALSSAGSYDAFVAQLIDNGPSGVFTGAQRGGGTANDEAIALALDATGSYVVGRYQGTAATFGSTTLVNAGAAGTSDIFVARLPAAGSTSGFSGAQRAGGPGDDRALAVALSGPAVYVGGLATLPATFGPLALSGAVAGPVAFLASIGAVALPTGQPAALAGVQLYPNPAHETVLLTDLPAAGLAPIATLHNALGQTVRTVTLVLAGGQATVPVAGLAAGVYALRLHVAGQPVLRRLVVE